MLIASQFLFSFGFVFGVVLKRPVAISGMFFSLGDWYLHTM
jgi:hypothetical protein